MYCCRAEHQFLLATEYAQRVIVDIAEADERVITQLMSIIEQLNATTTHYTSALTDASAFRSAFNSTVPLSIFSDVFDPDLDVLTSRRNDRNLGNR